MFQARDQEVSRNILTVRAALGKWNSRSAQGIFKDENDSC